MTLRELGAASGVAFGYIGELENGIKRNPGITTIAPVARALGVPLSILLGEEGEAGDLP